MMRRNICEGSQENSIHLRTMNHVTGAICATRSNNMLIRALFHSPVNVE